MTKGIHRFKGGKPCYRGPGEVPAASASPDALGVPPVGEGTTPKREGMDEFESSVYEALIGFGSLRDKHRRIMQLIKEKYDERD